MSIQLSQIDFGRGRIEFDDISALKDDSLVNQLEFLKEDLLQVIYPNDRLLDVGWYPSFDVTGSFQIRIIEHGNWDVPIYFAEEKCIEDLSRALTKAISLINTP